MTSMRPLPPRLTALLTHPFFTHSLIYSLPSLLTHLSFIQHMVIHSSILLLLRVLTMEFVTDMVPTNDAAALAKAGMNPYRVACMLSDMFAEMVFCTGKYP